MHSCIYRKSHGQGLITTERIVMLPKPVARLIHTAVSEAYSH